VRPRSTATLGGLSMNYDMGEFHVGGFFGFADDGERRRHRHRDRRALLLSHPLVGDGRLRRRRLGRHRLHRRSQPAIDENQTWVFIEPGLQMRAFIASNVALSFTGGITLGVADAEGVAVTAQPVALAGAHYYFF
jgi:hypothetical protein